MASGFYLSIDRADLLRAHTMLAGVKQAVPRVISRSVNRVLAGVRTDAVKEIRQEVNLPAAKVRQTFSIVRTTPSRLSGRVSSRGKPVGLIHFGARQTKRGVTVQVNRREKRGLIPHAFIGGAHGGRQVFWREFKPEQRKPARPGFAYGGLPRKYRLPVRKLFGPRVPDVMARPGVMARVERQAGERLGREFAQQIQYELSRL